MKPLQLILKKQWYDMILSGEKTEEYREIKPYWIRRLVNPRMMIDENIPQDRWAEFIIGLDARTFQWIRNSFNHIQMRNGYSKDGRSMLREFKGISIGEGRPEWGAEAGKKYFVIKLK